MRTRGPRAGKSDQIHWLFSEQTKSIRGAMREIAEKYGGKVPDTMTELCDLGGVGRKTANVVLGNAFEKSKVSWSTHM